MTDDALSPEQAARADHAHCHARWDHLTDEQQQGTTSHGWEAHMPREETT